MLFIVYEWSIILFSGVIMFMSDRAIMFIVYEWSSYYVYCLWVINNYYIIFIVYEWLSYYVYCLWVIELLCVLFMSDRGAIIIILFTVVYEWVWVRLKRNWQSYQRVTCSDWTEHIEQTSVSSSDHCPQSRGGRPQPACVRMMSM